jgi:hypothetical protein
MQINKLTHLGFYLNGALGSGRHDDVEISAVRAAINQGSIFDFLEETLGDDVDLSLLDNDDRAELLRFWQSLDGVDAERKMSVERNGLCLLVAFLLEGIQRAASELRGSR